MIVKWLRKGQVLVEGFLISLEPRRMGCNLINDLMQTTGIFLRISFHKEKEKLQFWHKYGPFIDQVYGSIEFGGLINQIGFGPS